MKRFIILTLFALTPVGLLAESWEVTSPDGQLVLEIQETDRGGLRYRVRLDSALAVGWSQLGLIRSGWTREGGYQETDFSEGLSFQRIERREIADEYIMVTGKQRPNSVEGNEMWLLFENADSHPIRIETRVYDQGVAFRYVFPDHDIVYHTVEKELTEFNMGIGGKLWAQPYQISGFWTPAYENFFKNGIALGTPASQDEGVGWAFPALFENDGVWALLHESGFDGGYHASQMEPNPQNGVYRIAPPDQRDAIGTRSHQSSSTLPWNLPWRFFVVSRDVGDILESNLVFDLAEPQAFSTTGWVKPGVASWSWWSDHDSSQNMEAMKTFIDLAADLDWPYSLIDANWNRIGDTSMEDLLAYAKKRGVKLLFWYNSGGPHNSVTEEPRNRLHEALSRRAEFERIAKLGVVGIKVDFFQSDKQFMMQLYLDILKDAAEFELMVDFHGCVVPRGWERTYPNFVTSEAVRGAEAYTFDDTYAENAPWHNTVLPFTRNVIGSMDYTPITWTEWNNHPRLTSKVHEIALAVVFESGIQHYADSVEAFRSIPKVYQDFLTNTPTVWDETRYLAGYPGRDVILARRHGKDWFIAGINGEDSAKTFDLDVSFLKGRKLKATLLYDGEDNDGFSDKNVQMDSRESLTVELKPFGGFVMILRQ